MVISIKNISQNQGGNGKNNYNDYEDIVNKFGGVANIRSIKPNQAKIKTGDVIDSLQFVYDVVTEDGMSHNHTGNKCGGNGGGIEQQPINFANDEQMMKISGGYSSYGIGKEKVINYLQFQTSRAPYNFGISSPTTETPFTLPAGVFFCSSGDYLNSLGTYEIVEVPQKVVTLPAETVTEISTTTDAVISTATVDSSRNLAIGLGASGFGVATLVAIGALVCFLKLKKGRSI